MKKLTILFFPVVMLGALFLSCDNKQKKPPVDLKEKEQVELNGEVSVPYSELGGVKTIPVKLNGVSMDMIFDTGCSGMSISLNELLTMQKNGKFSESDVVGITEATIADGSVVENMVVNLKEVVINDQILCPNVKATVSANINAPLLLGNEILDRLATIKIDNENETLNFKLK